MRATDFEYRHQTLLSQLIIAAGLASYFFDSDDVVWRFVKELPNRREFEHAIFFAASILIGAGALLCTRGRAMRGPKDGAQAGGASHLGELLFTVGLATLMPPAGFVIVVVAQAIRVLRLAARPDHGIRSRMNWEEAASAEAAKWGLLATMIIFSITLVDRHADILATVSYLTWALLNLAQQATSISQPDLTGDHGLRKLRQ